MKRFLLLLFILNLFACTSENKNNQTLSDAEWRQVLTYTYASPDGTPPFIYKDYENIKLKELLKDLYIYSADLGYEINDSILNYIENRQNQPISNTLDTMLNINFVHDTSMFNKNLIIYSEPFYLNNNILCIAVTKIFKPKNYTNQQVFFFRKKQGKFLIIQLYDVNKDKFYRPAMTNKSLPPGSNSPH